MAMLDLVANIDAIVFDVETALETQLGAQPLPFIGMDKSGSAVCVYYLEQKEMGCQRGSQCPFRHITGDKSVVCKHWLRGLCKKGDQCEFLHEYDLSKMPECYFFSKYNACSNKECPFRHIDPESKIKDCPWYDRGFCRHGPNCKARHRRRALCPKYLNGFCNEGPSCKLFHPSFDIPTAEQTQQARRPPYQASVICNNCHERGHKAIHCPNLPEGVHPVSTFHNHHHNNRHHHGNQMMFPSSSSQPTMLPSQSSVSPNSGGLNQHSQQPFNNYQNNSPGGFHHRNPHHKSLILNMNTEKKPLDMVTCFKCGEKGHYANKCNKGALAFLASTAHIAQEARQRDEQAGGGPQQIIYTPRNPAGFGQPTTNPLKRTRAGEMMRLLVASSAAKRVVARPDPMLQRRERVRNFSTGCTKVVPLHHPDHQATAQFLDVERAITILKKVLSISR